VRRIILNLALFAACVACLLAWYVAGNNASASGPQQVFLPLAYTTPTPTPTPSAPQYSSVVPINSSSGGTVNFNLYSTNQTVTPYAIVLGGSGVVVPAGSTLVLLAGGQANTISLSSVADNASGGSNTWTVDQNETGGAGFGFSTEIARTYVTNALSAGNTVTFTMSAADPSNYIAGILVIITNGASGSQPDVAAGGNSSATSSVSVSFTTSHTNSAIVGICCTTPNSTTWTGGTWTQIGSPVVPQFGALAIGFFYLNATSSGSQNPNLTLVGGASAWTFSASAYH
jgi:hypothetical protein